MTTHRPDPATGKPVRDVEIRPVHDGKHEPREPGQVPADSAIGTTHDPNSVTTGTEAEPDDRFPPKTGRKD